jgi:hypothetical protein
VLGDLVLESGADLLTQFRVVGVAVDGCGVLGGRPDHFFLFAGDGESAIRFAREISAIGYFAHDDAPPSRKV